MIEIINIKNMFNVFYFLLQMLHFKAIAKFNTRINVNNNAFINWGMLEFIVHTRVADPGA